MRISDWSSDVCSSDLADGGGAGAAGLPARRSPPAARRRQLRAWRPAGRWKPAMMRRWLPYPLLSGLLALIWLVLNQSVSPGTILLGVVLGLLLGKVFGLLRPPRAHIRNYPLAARLLLRVVFDRSEEHTSELQSLMRISYAVFCL